MSNKYRVSGRGFACIFVVAGALLISACAAENEKQNQSAKATESASKLAASETSAAVSEPQNVQQGSTAVAPYSVECGQVNAAGEPFCYVDRDTYIGWRTYHGFCHVCHAQDAVGSTFAPNLLDRMLELDKELYVDRMDNGFTGQVGVMPAWKDNPNVSKRYNELYAYLMARADGVLPPGRPTRKPN